MGNNLDRRVLILGGINMKDFSADAKLARKGDTEAFARLYAEVYEDLYHIALYCY